jgi:hypothetical protein
MALTDAEALAVRALMRELSLDRHDHAQVRRLFAVSIARIFVKEMRKLEALDDHVEFRDRVYWINGIDGRWPWTVDEGLKADQWTRYYVHRYDTELRHILDWLRIAAAEAHSWIDNVDAKGYPKKIMKCGSIPALVREADKQLRRIAAQDRTRQAKRLDALTALGPQDVTWQAELDHGLHLVRLRSPAALDDESLRMRHCIGMGSYDERLDDPVYAYYSVRDENDDALATLEVNGAVVMQFKGPLNTVPAAHVTDAVTEFMSRLGWVHWSDLHGVRMRLFEDYARLHHHLGMPFNIVERHRFREMGLNEQAAVVANLREIAGYGPDYPIPVPEVTPLNALDGTEGVSSHIIVDEYGPELVEIDSEEPEPFTP